MITYGVLYEFILIHLGSWLRSELAVHHIPPSWRMLCFGQFCWSSLVLSFSGVRVSASRSGSWVGGVQSMGSGSLGCTVRVGTEWMEAVWNELLDSWESEERMTIFCPKVEQLGLMLSGV